MPSMELLTPRLRLREFTLDDFAAVHAYACDREVTRYTIFGPNTEAQTREYLAEAVANQRTRARNNFTLAVTLRATGELIGSIGLRAKSETQGDMGYVYAKDAWGRGYATEAARALLAAAFRDPRVQRVVATTHQDNRASRRVMEKAGMTLTRVFRYTPEDLAAGSETHIPGQDLWDGDDVEYALTKVDWERQKRTTPDEV